MATLDWIILVLFFSCLVGIVLWVIKHKKDDTSDYFLSGRSETWLAVGAAIFAANIGSEHLVGLSSAGAERHGYAHWEMHGWAILIWVIFVPFYSHSKVFTMPGVPEIKVYQRNEFHAFNHHIDQLRFDKSFCHCLYRWDFPSICTWY
jgi:uncharacterized sodium:solute symporter family permease YidK